MHKPKKLNRNQIVAISIFIASIALLITFFCLATQYNTTPTENLYAAVVFSFMFGVLGIVSSVSLFLTKN